MRERSVGEFSMMSVAVSPLDKFREYLATKRKRLTQERAIIVEEVFSDHEHFEPEQLVARMQQREDGRRVSRSTVYRTLSGLEEAGLLRKVARNDKSEVYEHDYGYPQHDHLICKKCGSLTEFTNESISKLLDEVSSDHRFRMAGHRLEVYGICEKCSGPVQRRHPGLDRI
jgi:Fur family ferric uptake transcriptional regulator